jgi:hypothetical protein
MCSNLLLTLISGFRRHVDDIGAPLGHYARSYGNCLPTLWDNVWGPSSRVKSCNTLSRNTRARNVPEEPGCSLNFGYILPLESKYCFSAPSLTDVHAHAYRIIYYYIFGGLVGGVTDLTWKWKCVLPFLLLQWGKSQTAALFHQVQPPVRLRQWSLEHAHIMTSD